MSALSTNMIEDCIPSLEDLEDDVTTIDNVVQRMTDINYLKKITDADEDTTCDPPRPGLFRSKTDGKIYTDPRLTVGWAANGFRRHKIFTMKGTGNVGKKCIKDEFILEKDATKFEEWLNR